MSVSCDCSVLCGRGHCEAPIPRPEESYSVYVCVCVSLSVIRCNNKPLCLKSVGRRGKTEKDKQERLRKSLRVPTSAGD